MEQNSELKKITDKNGHAKTLCFTGHRSIPASDMDCLVKALDELIAEAIEDGFRVFLAGGAIGFDTVAAFRVLAAKGDRRDIKLMLILPCRNQTEKWKNLQNIREYQILKENADAVVYMQDFYDETCMMKRNRFMVEKSSRCIGYVTKARGGSAYTSNYAKKCGLEYINVADRMKEMGL